MQKVLKEHWKLILSSIILIPITVNFIVYFHAPFPKLVVGDANSWFSFFTTFVGTLVGALVSFAILYKTIDENYQNSKDDRAANQEQNEKNRAANQEENEKNRNLQIATIKYQIAKDELNVVINSLAKYQKSFDVIKLSSFTFHGITKDEHLLDLQSILQIQDESDIAYSLLNMNLVKYDDEKETEYKSFLYCFKGAYDQLLQDMIFIMDESFKRSSAEDVKRGLNEHEEKMDSIKIYTLREILKKYDFVIWKYRVSIMRELILAFKYKELYTILENFVKYEKDKIDKILLESVAQ